ncbi:GSCFA domain-containing protein [Jiulongibacter sp. NS-SX5]|uniref:GSCFA domain-containing protein n=1 Tax=Jiulongibacter sp. NS-SX5 TaxID=3463854 RepID=UPI004059D1D2
MNFRTEIEPVNFPFAIGQNDKIISVGSCFSDHFGEFLKENKVDCLSNPYGVIFNPVSIFRLLLHSLSERPVMRKYLTESNGNWYHYDYHSKLNGSTPESLTSDLEDIHGQVRAQLKKANYLIITLGTAYVYRLTHNQHVVANCHKKPADLFQKELLTQKEIGIRFRQFYEKLKMVNSRIKIIFTVSPVRHTKDTLQGNNLSKSLLRLATHYFCNDFKDVHYFPSYEILMDDLRDYRYYEEDMIHVNETGQKYVIENFRKSAFSKELNEFIDQWKQVRNQLHHKPFQPSSEAHQNFLRKLLNKLEAMAESVNVEKEKELVKAQLI